jgi:putative tryptophan/tyrosine transport system substrate-binding protein
MKRRDFITLLGGAVAWPLAARAQQLERKRRIGVLIQLVESDPEGEKRLAAFPEVLEKRGWRVGVNLQIDYRWAVSGAERAQTATAELLSLTQTRG